MKNSLNSSAQQPMIVKYVEALHNGIQSQALSRYAIGYILRGTNIFTTGISARPLRAETYSTSASGITISRTSRKTDNPSSKCSFIIRRLTSSGYCCT